MLPKILPFLDLMLLGDFAFMDRALFVNEDSCECQIKRNGLEADCAGLGLNHVPHCIPEQIHTLRLTLNSLHQLKPGIFKRFVDLRELYLDRNKISKVNGDIFKGLTKLTNLSLAVNNLRGNDSFSEDVFKRLPNLNAVWLQGNCNSRYMSNCTYPEKALLHAHNLTHLHIDGIGYQNPGNVFASLKNLHTLEMTQDPNSMNHGYCSIPYLSKDTFAALRFTQISHLNLKNCNIMYVEPYAFAELKSLSELSIVGNGVLCARELTNIFMGLNNTSISNLRLSHFCTFGTKPITLDGKISRSLSNTKLKALEITFMNIVVIQPSFVSELPLFLKYISFKGNRLHVLEPGFCTRLLPLKNLLYIDLSFQNQYRMTFANNSAATLIHTVENDANTTMLYTKISRNTCNLKYFKSVHTLNISYNYIEYINLRQFSNDSNLTTLFIQGNRLGKSVMGTESIFCNLRKLLRLDMSENVIRDLPKYILGH